MNELMDDVIQEYGSGRSGFGEEAGKEGGGEETGLRQIKEERGGGNKRMGMGWRTKRQRIK